MLESRCGQPGIYLNGLQIKTNTGILYMFDETKIAVFWIQLFKQSVVHNTYAAPHNMNRSMHMVNMQILFK